MSVSAKEQKTLQKMWKGAKDTGGNQLDAPDGTYQFKIAKAVFKVSGTGKPMVSAVYEIVGGDEEYVGVKGSQFDNLETPDNMGWFKRKLGRLGIKVPADIGELLDGTVCEEMNGRVFEGVLRTANDFQNLYVNKLVSKDGDDDDDEEEEESSEVSDGARVTFKRKGAVVEATVIEVDEDEETAVCEEDDGKVSSKKFSALTILSADADDENEEEDEEEESDDDDDDDAEGEEESDDDEEETEDEEAGEEEADEEEGDEAEWPESSAAASKDFTKATAGECLEAFGFAVDKQPKKLLVDLCKVDEGAALPLGRLKILAAAIGVKIIKGVTPKALAKSIKAKLAA